MHYRDVKGILSSSNGINVYRGCTHGCIYCDSRSDCYGMDHIFEDIEVKRNAPELLDAALRKKRTPCMVGTGSMCDPYLPLERTELLTRRCLEIIDRNGCGVAMLTKSDLALRDIDVIASIASHTRAVFCTTLTTFDEGLCRIIEPNVSTTRARFEMLLRMRDAGAETAVWLCPILPFINDTEENLNGLLDMCFEAGVGAIISFGFGVTLRSGSREYFYNKLDESFPGMRSRYQRAFGLSYSCMSENNGALTAAFRSRCLEHGVICDYEDAFKWLTRFESASQRGQLSIF